MLTTNQLRRARLASCQRFRSVPSLPLEFVFAELAGQHTLNRLWGILNHLDQ